jgi:hypothetical protein
MATEPIKRKRGKPKGLPRSGGGSRKGIPNKNNTEVRALFAQWGPDAGLGLAILAGITPPVERLPGVKLAEAEPVKKSAMDSILDRAYGKPTQPLQHSADESFESMLDRLGRG